MIAGEAVKELFFEESRMKSVIPPSPTGNPGVGHPWSVATGKSPGEGFHPAPQTTRVVSSISTAMLETRSE
jgi:hypothetical protein